MRIPKETFDLSVPESFESGQTDTLGAQTKEDHTGGEICNNF